ncbi:MAG: hypothetical protein PHS86_12510 [Syntrophaceae bacterium]|nr:hypothetical protein [Syntrophaceae bacterium]
MNLSLDRVMVSKLETMIREEMEIDGKIMVRSLDKIHARTGINYATISKVAERIQNRKHA